MIEATTNPAARTAMHTAHAARGRMCQLFVHGCAAHCAARDFPLTSVHAVLRDKKGAG